MRRLMRVDSYMRPGRAGWRIITGTKMRMSGEPRRRSVRWHEPWPVVLPHQVRHRPLRSLSERYPKADPLLIQRIADARARVDLMLSEASAGEPWTAGRYREMNRAFARVDHLVSKLTKRHPGPPVEAVVRRAEKGRQARRPRTERVATVPVKTPRERGMEEAHVAAVHREADMQRGLKEHKRQALALRETLRRKGVPEAPDTAELDPLVLAAVHRLHLRERGRFVADWEEARSWLGRFRALSPLAIRHDIPRSVMGAVGTWCKR